MTRQATWLAASVAMVTLASTGAARAQNDLPAVQPVDMSNVIMNDTLLKINLDNITGGSGKSSGKRKTKTRPQTRIVATTYRASPAVTERVKKQYVDWVAKQNPTGAEQLRAAFAKQSPVATWNQSVHSDGLRSGDVADSLASYMILNWLIVHRADNTRTQALAVRDQVRPILVTNPAYARLTNAQRQELAETWMVNFVMQLTAYTAASQRHDAALLARLGDAAETRFQNEMGLDLRRVSLTDHGFVAKR